MAHRRLTPHRSITYQSIFGGELALFTLAQFNRTDGPAEAIAHGELSGAVSLAGSDAVGDQPSVENTPRMVVVSG